MKNLLILFLLNLICLSSDNISRSLSGGTSTVNIQTSNAFGMNSPAIPSKDLPAFTFGNRLFNTLWAEAPSSVKKFDGLGPLFNRSSCSGCHLKDGRGRAPINPAEKMTSMLIRVSEKENSTHPIYGSQIQHKSIHGIKEEMDIRIKWEETKESYPDGSNYSLRSPKFIIKSQSYNDDDLSKLDFSPRVAPAVFGLGLLEAISEKDILASTDPNDQNKDGISGRANYAWDIKNQQNSIGRFGWKAGMPSIMQQNAKAAQEDIGLTNPIFPNENYTKEEAKTITQNAKKSNELDLSQEFLDFLEIYISNLAVPARRNVNNLDIINGEKLFNKISCTKCHTATFITSSSSLTHLNNQIIHPYTDLLLHDMGNKLADNRIENVASGQEWRTPPLWGIGLQKTVNKHTFFLHDGRARNLEEAILWHGGEALTSKNNFIKLDQQQRQQIIKFLNSL